MHRCQLKGDGWKEGVLGGGGGGCAGGAVYISSWVFQSPAIFILRAIQMRRTARSSLLQRVWKLAMIRSIIYKAFNHPDDPTRQPNSPDTSITDDLADGSIAFFEAIDAWRIWDARGFMPFLPLAHPPTIATLWTFSETGFEDGYPYAILLCGDEGASNAGRAIFLYGRQISHAG